MLHRKNKRRPSRDRAERVQKIDQLHSITELWAVLSETKDADWWKTPWNDGRNATRLGLELIETFGAEILTHDEEDVRLKTWIVEQVRAGKLSYTDCEDLLTAINGRLSLAPDKLLRATLRTVQLWISDSHGGGHGYNTLFEPLWAELPNSVLAAKLMRLARCQDALGISPLFDQSPNDKLRRAFYAAWDRGLYRIAYTVGGGQPR